MSQIFPYICHHYNYRSGCTSQRCPYLHICKLYIWGIPHYSRCNYYHGISMSDRFLLQSLGLNVSHSNILSFIVTFCAGQNPPRSLRGRVNLNDLRPKLEIPKPCRFYDSSSPDSSEIQCRLGSTCKFLHICSNLETRSSSNCYKCHGELRHIPTTREMEKLSDCSFDTEDPQKTMELYKTIMNKLLVKDSNFDSNSRPTSPVSTVSISSKPAKPRVSKTKPCEKHESKPCSEQQCPMFEFQGAVLWCVKMPDQNQKCENEWVPLPESTVATLERLYSDPCHEKVTFYFNETEFEVIFSNTGIACTSGNEVLRLFYENSNEPVWTWYWESNVELNEIFKETAFPKLLREFYSFDNKNKSWCPYGKNNGAKKSTNFDSQYLEKLRNLSLSLSVSGILQTFIIGTHFYYLNIEKFTQMNATTKHLRNIRRRPSPAINSFSLPQPEDSSIPLPSWFSNEDKHPRAIAVDEDSEEAQQMIKLVKEKDSSIQSVKVFKIQNHLIWKKFYVTREEMRNKFKESGLNEALLFHGTTSDVVTKIIEQNFDWRLSGTKVGERLGSGTYFTPNFETAMKYTGRESQRIVFVSLVLIGQFTLGEKGYRRPPENPSGGFYDSCVDKLEKPEKIVIFDNNQCYPLYYIEMKI